MKFYKRFPGDIGIKTGHLTPSEFGCYDRLLDHYYATEAAIPADRAYSICRAINKADQQACDRVLAQFFDLTDDGWVQQRADEMIAEALPRIEAARQNGKKGGRPRKQKPTGFSAGTHDATQQGGSEKTSQSQKSPSETNPPPGGVGGEAPTPPPAPEPPPAPPPPTPPAPPLSAAVLCRIAMVQAGLPSMDIQPANPLFLALVEAGATPEEFAAAARAAAGRRRPFQYALGVVQGERERAADAAKGLLRGPLPAAAPAPEPEWRQERRERMSAFAGPAAAKRPSSSTVIDLDDIDHGTARIAG